MTKDTYDWIVLMGLICLFILVAIAYSRINYIENQLKDVPKRVCHTEESVDKLEFRPISCYTDTNLKETNCVSELVHFSPLVNEIVCEKDIAIHRGEFSIKAYFNDIQNMSTTRVCLLITAKQVCEIK